MVNLGLPKPGVAGGQSPIYTECTERELKDSTCKWNPFSGQSLFSAPLLTPAFLSVWCLPKPSLLGASGHNIGLAASIMHLTDLSSLRNLMPPIHLLPYFKKSLAISISCCNLIQRGIERDFLKGYRFSVLQDEKRSGAGWLYNTANRPNTTKLYVFKSG